MIYINMGVSKNSGTPKSSILTGFSIIFTIHFGGKPTIVGNTMETLNNQLSAHLVMLANPFPFGLNPFSPV